MIIFEDGSVKFIVTLSVHTLMSPHELVVHCKPMVSAEATSLASNHSCYRLFVIIKPRWPSGSQAEDLGFQSRLCTSKFFKIHLQDYNIEELKYFVLF